MEDIGFDNISIDEKSHEYILIYDISCKTLTGAKPLRIRFNKINGLIRTCDETRYLVLLGLENHDAIYNRINPANIRLDKDVLKKSFVFVFRKRLQDVLIKTNIFALVIHLQETSSRRLGQDQYIRLGHTSSRCLQDVFKMSGKTSLRHLQDVFWTF